MYSVCAQCIEPYCWVLTLFCVHIVHVNLCVPFVRKHCDHYLCIGNWKLIYDEAHYCELMAYLWTLQGKFNCVEFKEGAFNCSHFFIISLFDMLFSHFIFFNNEKGKDFWVATCERAGEREDIKYHSVECRTCFFNWNLIVWPISSCAYCATIIFSFCFCLM